MTLLLLTTSGLTLAALTIGETNRSSTPGLSPAGVVTAVGHFDLDVQKSKALRLGKSHIETVSAFVTYTDRFFGGRVNAFEIRLYAAPIDAAAQTRLLENERDDRDLTRVGAAFLVVFVDNRNQVTQVNLTYMIPGTTVVRTIAWLPADLAKWSSALHYADGRLRLKSKGLSIAGQESPDDQLTLAWDVDLDVSVVNRIGLRHGRGG